MASAHHRKIRRHTMTRALLLLLLHIAASQSQVVEETVRPCDGKRQRRCCGDGKCGRRESIVSCPEDCPGVTTDAQCGEEPHSDTGGYAVVRALPRIWATLHFRDRLI